MNRGTFLKTSAAIAGGLMVKNTWANGLFANERKMRVGIIGCGDRGKGLLEICKKLPNQFEVTAICDNLSFRIKETLELTGPAAIKTYADYRHLLDNKDIDAVMIATPLNEHFGMAKDALLAGKHVYLEKTMTYSISEAMDLVKLVKKYPKQTFQVGHQYRYTPLYFKVKQMIEEDSLGKITQIDCRWDRNWNWKRAVPDPSLERQVNWRMYRAYSGGLPAELLSHQMDFINWAFDTQPDKVMGAGGVDFYKDGRETYDNVQVIMRYEQADMIGNFGATCGNAHDGYLFKLKGTKGSVSLLMDKGIFYPEKETIKQWETVDGVTGSTRLTLAKDGGLPIKSDDKYDGTWYALKDFHECIMTGRQPHSNVFTGAKTSFCVHMANRAMHKQSIEKWKGSYNLV